MVVANHRSLKDRGPFSFLPPIDVPDGGVLLYTRLTYKLHYGTYHNHPKFVDVQEGGLWYMGIETKDAVAALHQGGDTDYHLRVTCLAIKPRIK